jgi:hypothetical protein
MTVKIQVPCVDIEKVDINNVLDVILSMTNYGFCKIGTKNVILLSHYTRKRKEIYKLGKLIQYNPLTSNLP